MNCVGVDVSKGKRMIAVMRPLGKMVIPSFEVGHTNVEPFELSRLLGKLDDETCVVMEATGNYHMPVACFLHDSGFYGLRGKCHVDTWLREQQPAAG